MRCKQKQKASETRTLFPVYVFRANDHSLILRDHLSPPQSSEASKAMEIKFMVTSFIYGELGTVTKTRKTELEKNEDFVKK